MITNDFNLINVDFYVEYMVTDPIQAVRHRNVYESIIKNLAQSYIRDTVGLYNVDDVITTGKTQIQERVKEQLTNRLVEENIGYGIYNVSIQDSGMPREDVSNAFKAVEDAKQGMETAINTAKKYQSENIPKANAEADKLLQEAEAYKQQRINEANGQVARFEDTYAEYVKYPLITKKRMFYEDHGGASAGSEGDHRQWQRHPDHAASGALRQCDGRDIRKPDPAGRSAGRPVRGGEAYEKNRKKDRIIHHPHRRPDHTGLQYGQHL